MSPQSVLQMEREGSSIDDPAIPVHCHFEAHAAQRPEATAVLFGDARFSYCELNRRANQLARYLVAAGVGAESRVVVCLKPSLEIAVCLLAILKAGGAYVPVDPNDPADRIATILADVSPTIILTQSTLAQSLDASAPVFFFDRDWNRAQALAEENLEFDIDHEQTAYVVYTSGTTGRPKGVMASHRNLCHYVLAARDRYGFTAEDVMCAVARFTFSISLFELLTPIAAGGATLILEREEVLNFKRMVGVLERITIIHASPTWWRKLFCYIGANGQAAFGQVRHASSGGDKVPGDLLEMLKCTFPKAEIFVIYGCTEISCMSCTYPALRDRTETKTLLGRPFANVEARLFDEDTNPVPAGGEGEIYVAGPGVTKGYLNLPKLTAEKFVAIDGRRFYRTGDLGRWENGNLQITGRVDFQIQLRGIRIEPGEIETHLRQAPGIRDAVVVARELGTSEKSLVAYVVLDSANNIAPVREFLRAKLPDYMVPAAFVRLDAIPVNSNQKVDRRALPAPTAGNLVREETIVPPKNDLEKELVAIWEDSLGIRPIGTRQSFFDLGGDSLQAVQIVMQIEQRWDKTLPITILLEAKSIEALANVVREPGKDFAGENSIHEIVTLRRGGTRPPLFCLQGVWLYQEVAQNMDIDQPVYGVFLEEEVELIKTRQYDPVNSVFATIPRLAERYLRSIRAVQAHGPYYLAGSSFAGLIAFEMARQLRALGEEAKMVALFDSMMIKKISLRRRLRCHWDLFAEQGFTYLLKKLRRRLKGGGGQISVGGQPNEQIRSFAAPVSDAQEEMLDEVSAHAARSFEPQPHPGELVLFRAMDQTFFSENVPDLGWTPYAAGEFKIYDVPGNHMGILRGNSATILARHLQAFIASRDR